MSSLYSLDVMHLSVCYEDLPILWDVTLKVPNTGLLVGLIGPNGAGKSSLIKSIVGLVKPSSGSVKVYDRWFKDVSTRVSYVPQRNSIDMMFPITVSEAVMMGAYNRIGLWRSISESELKKCSLCIGRVGMSDFSDKQISKLSGGQQQRVFIARALMQEADLYLLDEPFIGVDTVSYRTIMKVLRELADSGKTVIVVHHDVSSARELFDWAILLNKGLVACGPIEDVFTEKLLRKLYGDSNVLADSALKRSMKISKGKL